MADYDVGDALSRIEDILLQSMRRNLHRHLGEEQDEELRWTMWQAEQLTALRTWSAKNLKSHAPELRRINDAALELLREANQQGELDEEERLLLSGHQQAEQFFHPPGERFDALLTGVRHDLSRAEHSMLRQADDVYRKALFDAHTYLQTGVGDLKKAVDMAVEDLDRRGIRSVIYRNGHRVEASTYARMALRSASVRARLMGEGKARDRMGIHTVIVPPSGIACAKCAVWMGRVLVDDVYSSGTAAEAAQLGVPLLSDAIRLGFLHPQCNCSPSTFEPGISKMPTVTEEDRENAVKRYKLTQKQRYNERQIRKWKQIEKDAPDKEAKASAKAKLRSWQAANKQLCDEHSDILRRDYSREKIYDFPDKPIVPNVIDKTPPEPGVNAQVPADNAAFLEKWESENYNSSTERGLLVFPDGTTKAFDGIEHHVTGTSDDIKLMDGAAFTHNHPTDNTFSQNDIVTGLVKGNLKEMRAATSTGDVHILANNGSTEEQRKKFSAAYQQRRMKAANVADAKIRRGEKLDKDAYIKSQLETFMSEHAKEYNLSYTKSRVNVQNSLEIKLTNASGHGIITVEADEFVPCLKDAKTGALLETEVKKVAESASLSDCTLANGWDFPWNEAPKDCDVYSLHVKGSNNIEGLVALRSDDAAWGVYMQWGNAAPHNQGQNKKYIGVGGHLFAIAAKVSIEKGYGGFIFADAANEELFRLFVDKYGATPFSTRIRPYRFGFEGEALLNILNTYNFDWGE